MNDRVYMRLTKKVGEGEDAQYLDIKRVAIGNPEDPWFRETYVLDCLDMLREIHEAATRMEDTHGGEAVDSDTSSPYRELGDRA